MLRGLGDVTYFLQTKETPVPENGRMEKSKVNKQEREGIICNKIIEN
jgi:hypothetical protein